MMDQTVQLGPKKRASLCEWRGEMRMDVRETESGLLTKKGVSLGLDKIKKLHATLLDVTMALGRLNNGENIEFKVDLGDGVFVSVTSPYAGVDLRQFFKSTLNEEQMYLPAEWKATKRGVFLTVPEWVEMYKFCYKMMDKMTTSFKPDCQAPPPSPPNVF